MRLTGVAVLLCTVLLTAGAGTRSTYAPDVTGKWRPWSGPYLGSERERLPAAEQRLVLETLAQLAGPFQRAAVFNPPMGFEVKPHRSIRPYGEKVVIIRRCPDCPVRVNGEYPMSVSVYVNAVGQLVPDRSRYELATDEQGSMYPMPIPAGRIAGFSFYRSTDPAYGGGGLIITGPRVRGPLFVPVSQERFLRAKIRDQAERAAWFERRRKRDDYTRTEASRHRELQREYEAELVALSPQERAAQAYCCSAEFRRRSFLAPSGARGTHPVVSVNPAVFHPSLPRTAVQLVVVQTLAGNPARRNPFWEEVDRHVWATVDWAALAALLAR